jgi:hypothetical protein
MRKEGGERRKGEEGLELKGEEKGGGVRKRRIGRKGQEGKEEGKED